jgi:hypothetical protein
VSGPERDERKEPAAQGAVGLYCMAAMVADEASRHGLSEFARSMEGALETLLLSLTREEQDCALRLSYEMALGGDEPAHSKLRLVYSRD